MPVLLTRRDGTSTKVQLQINFMAKQFWIVYNYSSESRPLAVPRSSLSARLHHPISHYLEEPEKPKRDTKREHPVKVISDTRFCRCQLLLIHPRTLALTTVGHLMRHPQANACWDILPFYLAFYVTHTHTLQGIFFSWAPLHTSLFIDTSIKNTLTVFEIRFNSPAHVEHTLCDHIICSNFIIYILILCGSHPFLLRHFIIIFEYVMFEDRGRQ